MRFRSRANNFAVRDPYADWSSMTHRGGQLYHGARKAKLEKHPCPAIGFLLAGAFGAAIWTVVAALLLW